MKKVIWGFVIVLLLIVGTALVGPGMIDWNRYKSDATKQVKVLTGRDLKIMGDVQVSIFPAPAIIANDVSFSNMDGAVAPEMVKLRQVEVRIALSPLLAGQIKVETVRLIEPTIELELLADGRQNWDIQPPGNKASVSAPKKSEGAAPSAQNSASTAPDFTLDDFTIVDGALNYRDSKTGEIEKIEGLNARIEAASLAGPFQSKGALKFRSIPLTYDITVGEVIQERTLPLNMKFGVGAGDSSLHIGGTLLGLSDDPKFKGSFKGEGKNLGLLIEAITRTPAPPALAQLFSAEGNISGSATGGELSNLNMQLADSRVEGNVAFEMADVPRFAVSLDAKRFNLDKWLEAPNAGPASGDEATNKSTTPTHTSAVATPATAPIPADVSVVIPKSIAGSVIISAGSLVYRGESINDVLINTDLANGEAQLGQFSAQFPGGSDISMSGVLSSPEGKPEFSGVIETNSNDIRYVAKWLGADLSSIPSDRLHKIDFSSDVKLTPAAVELQNIDLQFDSSRLTGATTIALRSRPALGVNLTLDQIDLDAYLPKSSATRPTVAASGGQDQAKQAGAGSVKTAPASIPDTTFSGLRPLTTFDANALIRIKRLRAQGATVNGVVVDATLFDGDLNIKKLSVSEFSGLSISGNGQLKDLGNVPSLAGLKVKAQTKNATQIVRLSGLALPFDPKNLGTVSVDMQADGSILKPKLTSLIKAAGATVSANGRVSVLPVGDLFDLDLKLAHPDFAKLIRRLGVKYRPAGAIGQVALATRANGNAKQVALQKLSGNVGDLKFSGNATVLLDGALPMVSADLNTGAVILDQFLPATNSASLEDGIWGSLKGLPVAWRGPDLSTQASPYIKPASTERWPADPIDLSALRSLNANIKLKSPLVAYSKYLFENVDLIAQINDGTLSTQRLVAGFFGGKLNGSAQLSARNKNALVSAFDITGIQISEALTSVTGTAAASGVLNAKMDIRADAQSVEGLVTSLSGTGGFTMTGVDASASTKGSAFAGVYSLLTSLNQLGSKGAANKADVSGSFQIAQGIARTSDLKLVSPLGNGEAQGTVDLAAWLLNIKGQIQLKQNALTQILQARLKSDGRPIGFGLSGPLDAPNVKVDTASLLGSTIPIPGANAIINKAPKKIGKLLQGILGGGAASEPATAQPAEPAGDTPPPARSTQQSAPPAQKFRPEDLLKQLFK